MCMDVDECQLQGTGNCSEHADCNNVDGSFTCNCTMGFTGDGFNCTGK